MFHVGTSDTARSSLRSIKKDYRALGAAVRDSGVQVFFSSIVLVKGKGFERAIESGESTNGYRTGATARGLAT